MLFLLPVYFCSSPSFFEAIFHILSVATQYSCPMPISLSIFYVYLPNKCACKYVKKKYERCVFLFCRRVLCVFVFLLFFSSCVHVFCFHIHDVGRLLFLFTAEFNEKQQNNTHTHIQHLITTTIGTFSLLVVNCWWSYIYIWQSVYFSIRTPKMCQDVDLYGRRRRIHTHTHTLCRCLQYSKVICLLCYNRSSFNVTNLLKIFRFSFSVFYVRILYISSIYI